MKRIMVDMSATIIHHGHIRLLRTASNYGNVIVALTTDEEIERNKGYRPELDFESRREIIESIRYVDAVVPSPWLIEESFLNRHQIDLLVHGSDNRNPVSSGRVLVFPRTPGVSSSIIKARVLRAISDIYLNKE